MWLSIALSAGCPLAALAQKGGAAKAVAEGPASIGREAEQTKQSAVDPTKVKRTDPTEVWKDPNASAALPNTFPELPTSRFLTRSEIDSVMNMATGQALINREVLKRYIQNYAADLTRHTNIEAYLSIGGFNSEGEPLTPQELSRNAGLVKGIETAASQLSAPLIKAEASRNTAFRAEYTRALIPVVGQLLKNHLIARIQGMIVLSRSGDPEAIPTFVAALKDPNQLLSVKERAAVGLIQVGQGGRALLNPGQQAIPAAEGLTTFLEQEPNAFWPAKARALEALGALRQSTSRPGRDQADFATAVMKYLADPKAKFEVRVAAAWAMGWMRIDRQVPKYNFALIAYHIGQLAAEIGDRIVEVEPENPYRTRHLTNLELQLLESLVGDTSGPPNDTGLSRANHPALASARVFISQVQQRIHGVAGASIALSNAAGQQRTPRRNELAAQVEDLKSFLTKNTPTDRKLVPGGDDFPGPKAQVAAGDK
ncbi:MAG: hypothetical protein ABI353_02770 [Isosphaeraceae bacterium]